MPFVTGKPMSCFPLLLTKTKNWENMKKIFYFAMICLWVLGTIGGFGYSAWCGAYPIAAGVAATGWMAWPTVKNYFDKLMN